MKALLTAATLLLCWQDAHLQSTYCDITEQHTMCQYTGEGEACLDPYSEWIPSETDIEDILIWHNDIRSKAASGAEDKTDGGGSTLPEACNMRELSWDEELATIAQRYADQCIFEHDCNECRSVLNKRISAVGQNIAESYGEGPQDDSFVNVMSIWYTTEVGSFSVDLVEEYVFDDPYGHYSQLIWGETSLVGCGGSKYQDSDGQNHQYVVCNYGVAGNYDDDHVYKTGVPAGCCPDGSSSSGSLCA